MKIKKFMTHYRHALLPVVYWFFYMTAFFYLEQQNTTNFHVIHMKIDDYIPFCEYFVIPYYAWFLYIAAVVVLFIFLDKKDYYRLCIMLGVGMTVFLIVSYVYPNGHLLRPTSFPRDNIFVDMIRLLYRADTSTNIFPSIHCYNAIAANIAIHKSRQLSDKKWLQWGSGILSITIVVSTMFIKQHSAFDVITAILMAGIMYLAVYQFSEKKW